MQWVLVFLLFVFMLGVKIEDGAILEWIWFLIGVAMFLTAIIACRIW